MVDPRSAIGRIDWDACGKCKHYFDNVKVNLSGKGCTGENGCQKTYPNWPGIDDMVIEYDTVHCGLFERKVA